MVKDRETSSDDKRVNMIKEVRLMGHWAIIASWQLRFPSNLRQISSLGFTTDVLPLHLSWILGILGLR